VRGGRYATYFPTSAVVSIVVTPSSGQVAEAAMVGRDGVIGAAAALDGQLALSRAVIQLSGEAMVCNLAGLNGRARHVRFTLPKADLARHQGKHHENRGCRGNKAKVECFCMTAA
jgi:hypothetical protein